LAAETMDAMGEGKKDPFLSSAGKRSLVVHYVASHYIDLAAPSKNGEWRYSSTHS